MSKATVNTDVRYYKVSPRFWHDLTVRTWSASQKLLALYLITCPHRNVAGMYYLPFEYIVSDLELPRESLERDFEVLIEDGFIEYDSDSRVALLVNALKYDPPTRGNQVVGAVKGVGLVPETPLLARLCELADRHCPYFADALRSHFGEALKSLESDFEPRARARRNRNRNHSRSSSRIEEPLGNDYDDDQSDDQSDDGYVGYVPGDPNPAPIHTPDLNAFFETHFGTNLWHMDRLRLFVERGGMDEQTVVYALELALEAGATQGIKYPLAVLQSWQQAGIKTRQQAESHEQRRKQRQGQVQQGTTPTPNGKRDPYRKVDVMEEIAANTLPPEEAQNRARLIREMLAGIGAPKAQGEAVGEGGASE